MRRLALLLVRASAPPPLCVVIRFPVSARSICGHSRSPWQIHSGEFTYDAVLLVATRAATAAVSTGPAALNASANASASASANANANALSAADLKLVPATKWQWQELTPMRTPRTGSRAVVWRDDVIVVCGGYQWQNPRAAEAAPTYDTPLRDPAVTSLPVPTALYWPQRDVWLTLPPRACVVHSSASMPRPSRSTEYLFSRGEAHAFATVIGGSAVLLAGDTHRSTGHAQGLVLDLTPLMPFTAAQLFAAVTGTGTGDADTNADADAAAVGAVTSALSRVVWTAVAGRPPRTPPLIAGMTWTAADSDADGTDGDDDDDDDDDADDDDADDDDSARSQSDGADPTVSVGATDGTPPAAAAATPATTTRTTAPHTRERERVYAWSVAGVPYRFRVRRRDPTAGINGAWRVVGGARTNAAIEDARWVGLKADPLQLGSDNIVRGPYSDFNFVSDVCPLPDVSCGGCDDGSGNADARGTAAALPVRRSRRLHVVRDCLSGVDGSQTALCTRARVRCGVMNVPPDDAAHSAWYYDAGAGPHVRAYDWTPDTAWRNAAGQVCGPLPPHTVALYQWCDTQTVWLSVASAAL